MLDNFGRKIDYVRISVTDRCDLRCKYCMPESNPNFYKKEEILDINKLKLISESLIDLGIRKFRITGGEPLVRKDIVEYIEFLSKKLSKKVIDEILLTTNGTQLKKYSKTLSDLGVKRVNVSLDSLIKEKFNFITNGGNIESVFEGIESAKENKLSIKINTVLLKNFNDDELLEIMKWCSHNSFTLSFIEVMPVGDMLNSRKSQYFSVNKGNNL